MLKPRRRNCRGGRVSCSQLRSMRHIATSPAPASPIQANATRVPETCHLFTRKTDLRDMDRHACCTCFFHLFSFFYFFVLSLGFLGFLSFFSEVRLVPLLALAWLRNSYLKKRLTAKKSSSIEIYWDIQYDSMRSQPRRKAEVSEEKEERSLVRHGIRIKGRRTQKRLIVWSLECSTQYNEVYYTSLYFGIWLLSTCSYNMQYIRVHIHTFVQYILYVKKFIADSVWCDIEKYIVVQCIIYKLIKIATSTTQYYARKTEEYYT